MPVIARDIYDQGIKEEYSKAKGLAREDDEEKRLRNEIEIAKKEELKESIEENWQIGKAVVGATGKAIAGYAKAGYGIAKGTYGAAKKTKDAGVAAVNGLQNAVSWTASNVILFLFAVIFVHAIDISLGFNNFITRFWLYMGLTVWAWLALFKQPGTKAEFRDLLVFILIPIILSYTIELVPLLKNEYTLLIFIFIWMIAGIYLASESLKEPMIISAVSLFLPYAIHFAEKTNAQIPLGYILIWIPPWILYLFFMSRAEGKFFNILKFAYTGALLIFLIIPTVASALSVPAYADFIKVNLKTDNAVKLMQDNFKISMGFIAKAITGGFTSIQKSYQAQIFYATHGYYQGETEDTKQFVGIRLLEPSIQNKLQYSPEEKFFETRTAIEAYNPKQKFKVAYSCTTQSDECFQLTEKTECPATASTITPKEELVLSEQSYYTEATCYPKLQLGWNSVSISTTLLDFTTESRLTTFFIDFDAMNQIVASYRREKNIQTEVDILQIPQFSSIRNVKTVSISDPGPVKLIIAVPTKQPIFGVKRDSTFPIVVAAEQSLEFGVTGEITGIKELTLKYPQGIEPVSVYSGITGAVVAGTGAGSGASGVNVGSSAASSAEGGGATEIGSEAESGAIGGGASGSGGSGAIGSGASGGFEQGSCEAYEKAGDNTLKVRKEYLQKIKINFSGANQVPLPSCYFIVKDSEKFLSKGINLPNSKTLIANIKYDYKLTKQFKIKYGEKPKEGGAGTIGGTGAGAGGCAPSGSQVERVIQVARSEGLGDESIKMVLKVAKLESSLEHYSPPGSGTVKTSNVGARGIMQIYPGAHKNCFETIKYVAGNTDLCTGSSLCEGKTANDLDCNIQAGVRFLKSLYAEAQSTGGQTDPCGGRTLTGWNYAFRAYNGWACNDYVEKVNFQDISAYEKSISSIQFCAGEATTLSQGTGTCSGDFVNLDGANSGFKLRKSAADQFKVAEQKAKKKGYTLNLNYAYRTEQKQAEFWNLYRAGKGNVACGPDKAGSYLGCPHVIGCAVDIANPYSEISQSVLDEIMFSSDWIRYKQEDWHYEYGTSSWQTAKAKGERTYG